MAVARGADQKLTCCTDLLLPPDSSRPDLLLFTHEIVTGVIAESVGQEELSPRHSRCRGQNALYAWSSNTLPTAG